MSWKRAFLRQARSDLLTYRILQEGGADKCQILHYLQMAGEKLAKAESDEASDGRRPSLSPTGFSRWMKALANSAGDVQRLGFKGREDFAEATRSLVETAKLVEQLAPKLANDRASGQTSSGFWSGVGVNAEYPWDAGADGPIAPSDYPFTEGPLGPERLLKLALLIDARIAQRLGEPRILR